MYWTPPDLTEPQPEEDAVARALSVQIARASGKERDTKLIVADRMYKGRVRATEQYPYLTVKPAMSAELEVNPRFVTEVESEDRRPLYITLGLVGGTVGTIILGALIASAAQ